MPIEALPVSTSRVIGSTLVLSDAKSVVKELIDNALDARATTINIDISQNTLDVIQVKDNGTGIGVQDRQLLCKRGCTSKIRSLEDLGRLGGSFLGFRGEALASIAELSRAAIITTRVDGEIVGSSLTFGPSGMLSSSSASHPVGTTFRVQSFLHNIPVRKQTALKSAAKALQAIKALLYSFAFARPNVRFSLKVLKAKSDKGNWTYAPSPKDALTEVASKIVGQDIVSECAPHLITSDDTGDAIGEGWTIEGLLLSRTADLSKIRNAVQYISIDGRPMTSDRGTIKEIVKLYKHKFQASHQSPGNLSISRPFLCLRIECPPESYDVNVEPAKDEVLFFRPASLVSMLERLFERVYPICATNQSDCRLTTEALQGQSSSTDFDHDSPQDGEHLATRSQECVQDVTWTPNEVDDTLLSNITVSNPFTIAAMTARVEPKKMNFTSTFDSATLTAPSRSPVFEEYQGRTALEARPHRTPLGQNVQLPSPIASSGDASPYEIPPSPLRSRAMAVAKQTDGHGAEPEEPGHERNEPSSHENTFLKTWLTPQTGTRRTSEGETPTTETSSNRPDRFDMLERQALPDMNTLSPTANSASALRWGSGSKAFRPPLKSSSKVQKPTGTIPVLTSTPQDGDGTPSTSKASGSIDTLHGRSTIRKASNETLSLGRKTSQRTFHDSTLTDDRSTELEEILEFEYRKKAAIAHQRHQAAKFPSRSVNDILKSRAAEGNSSNVHHSDTSISRTGVSPGDVAEEQAFAARFCDVHHTPREPSKFQSHENHSSTAAKGLAHSHPRVDEASQNDLPRGLSASPLPDDDPRAYFIRQQQKSGRSTLYRSKSAKLPLETIPPDMATLHLLQTVDAFRKPQHTQALVQYLSKHDQYVVDGRITYADLVESSLPMGWEHTVRGLFKKTCRDQDLGMTIDDVEIKVKR